MVNFAITKMELIFVVCNWNDSNLIELMKMCLDNELYFCLFGESYKTAILCQVLYWSHKISWEETFLCLHVCFLLYVLLQ